MECCDYVLLLSAISSLSRNINSNRNVLCFLDLVARAAGSPKCVRGRKIKGVRPMASSIFQCIPAAAVPRRLAAMALALYNKYVPDAVQLWF